MDYSVAWGESRVLAEPLKQAESFIRCIAGGIAGVTGG